MVTRQHILSEIRRTAAANGGRALGKARFQAETGIRETDWSGRYWTSWTQACMEAGFEPNAMQAPHPVEYLLHSLASLTSELGHFPTVAELTMKRRSDSSFPSSKTFDRIGGRAERIQRLNDYSAHHPEFTDVCNICTPLLETASDVPYEDDDSADSDQFGFVYLMKSGRYYKVGRSACAEKRAYEVQLVLPEELKLIHKIKTDDPVGIEAYWHSRFADRRLRGEWFNLSAQDIPAFRRRAFM